MLGASWTDVGAEPRQQIDELVFDVCADAARAAGVRRHEIGLSVICSLDLYDGRSISSALESPAAAGYLNHEIRIEGDSIAALGVAATSLLARTAEIAVVVAVNVPEIGSTGERELGRFTRQISSYTFDPWLDRPVGMSADATLGLHAARAVDTGATTLPALAEQVAGEIRRGRERGVGRRDPVGVEEVLAAPLVSAPLTELMLPAHQPGVGAVVLATEPRARRAPRPRARIAGWGTASGDPSHRERWLLDPAAGTRAAAQRAYARAGIGSPAAEITAVEMTDLSPALTSELLDALELREAPSIAVNSNGGVRSRYPGLANGVLRLVEAIDALAEAAPAAGPAKAVVHGADNLNGLVLSTATVFVLEEM